MEIELLYAAQTAYLSSLHFSHGGDFILQRQMSENTLKIELRFKND